MPGRRNAQGVWCWCLSRNAPTLVSLMSPTAHKRRANGTRCQRETEQSGDGSMGVTRCSVRRRQVVFCGGRSSATGMVMRVCQRRSNGEYRQAAAAVGPVVGTPRCGVPVAALLPSAQNGCRSLVKRVSGQPALGKRYGTYRVGMVL